MGIRAENQTAAAALSTLTQFTFLLLDLEANGTTQVDGTRLAQLTQVVLRYVALVDAHTVHMLPYATRRPHTSHILVSVQATRHKILQILQHMLSQTSQ